MRKIFLLLVFLFSGCGTSIVSTNDATDKFSIGNTMWELSLPDGWTKVDPPEAGEAIFLAYNKDVNFTILRLRGHSVDLEKQIFDNAKQDFFWFQEISFSPEIWSFQAKTSPSSPIREYVQKLFLIPETDLFLLGSCAFSPTLPSSDCEDILASWQILVDKKSEDQ